jgi:excinuclease UvrABC ATPase subunit
MLEKMYVSLTHDENGERLTNSEWANRIDYNETIKEVLQEITNQFIRPKKGFSRDDIEKMLNDMHCGGCDGYELNCDFGALLQKNLMCFDDLTK